jgi:hypothetical protein
MTRMIRYPELAANNLGYPLQGPQVCLVSPRWSPSQEDGFQATQIVPGQFSSAAGLSGARQRGLAARSPGRVPTTGGLATDAQLPRDFGLRATVPEQRGRTDAAPLLGHVIAASPTQWRNPFHRGWIALQRSLVTRFCETQ